MVLKADIFVAGCSLAKERFIDELKTARNKHKTGEVTEERKTLDEMKLKYGL